VSFAYPLVLIGLVIPLVLLLRVWSRPTRGVALPFDHGVARSRTGLRVLLALAESVPPLLLAVALLILAGPLELAIPKSRRKLTNIQFCVDISGSMTAEFEDGSRYDGSMAAINEFLDYRDGDAFGLTFFGTNVLHWVPLTNDVSAFRCAPPFMRPENVPPWYGGTMIGKALLACREVLVSREDGDRMIILVSDGESFDLAGSAAEDIARRLRDDRIVVYAVHIAEGEVPGPIVDITEWTGGESFQPGDQKALDAVFARIDEMQQTELVKSTPEQIDGFAPFVLLATGLLALHLLLQFALRYTPW
jgi:Ca-activated chloride channel family protein